MNSGTEQNHESPRPSAARLEAQRRQIARTTIDRSKTLTERLESGEPINCRVVGPLDEDDDDGDEESPGRKLVERLKRFTERLESGEPIECTRVMRHETPDGPMHTFERGFL